jgi:hypothetical protein
VPESLLQKNQACHPRKGAPMSTSGLSFTRIGMT